MSYLCAERDLAMHTSVELKSLCLTHTNTNTLSEGSQAREWLFLKVFKSSKTLLIC